MMVLDGPAHQELTARPLVGLPGYHSSRKKYLIIYGKSVCSGGVWWSARSKLRLLCLPGGAPQKAHEV